MSEIVYFHMFLLHFLNVFPMIIITLMFMDFIQKPTRTNNQTFLVNSFLVSSSQQISLTISSAISFKFNLCPFVILKVFQQSMTECAMIILNFAWLSLEKSYFSHQNSFWHLTISFFPFVFFKSSQKTQEKIFLEN